MAYTINISFLFYFCRRQTASQRQSTFTQPRPQPVLAKSMPRPPVAARRPVPLPRSLSATSGATTSGAATSGAVAAGVRKCFFFFRLCVSFCFILFYCVEKSILNNDLYWRKSNQNVMRLLTNHNTSQRISYLDWMQNFTLPYVCFTSWLSRR